MEEQSPVTTIEHPLIRTRLARLRDKETDSIEFRRCLHEVAQLMAFEVTRDFETTPIKVTTPLAVTDGAVASRPLVLVPILRAGLGMVHGILAVLPEAQVGHIGMRRDENTHLPETYYCNTPPNIESAEVLLVDPMLATGNSSADAATHLKEEGATRIRFICLVGCPEGIAHFQSKHPDIPIFTAAIDEKLNEKAYIIPGLGDAGDRYFGTV